MKKCDHCGAKILFSPVQEGDYQFCSPNCRKLGIQRIAKAELPDGFVYEKALEIHQGPCPQCGGEGPVDVHTSHQVISFLMMTSFKSQPEICCRRCGNIARGKAIFASGLLGWWGIPIGLLATPVQILRNLGGMFSSSPTAPSPALVEMVRAELATRLMASPRAAERLATESTESGEEL
jgi:hypothetical protein